MLRLKLKTDPRWADLTQLTLEEILTDHAFCEQKAASSCISLIQQYSFKTEIVERVSPIVTEEWGHFRQVLSELKRRGLKLGRQRKDEYVNKLRAFQKKTSDSDEKLLELLLTCAMIEARSCERFRVLSENLEEAHLRKFYRTFMISEAGHYTLFIELAYLYFGKSLVRARWKEYLEYEGAMIQTLSLSGRRVH